VIGEAGMGKSRLIHEMVRRHGAHAMVLRGRCLPYGDGITFWPLVEMAAPYIRADDSADEAQARLRVLTGDADVAARLASAIGLSTVAYPLHELKWAARRFLQSLARQLPVIAVVDDIHWAEQAFLELLEHVLDEAKDSPILLLASARHELVEERPTWPDRPNATRVVLHPLSADAAETLLTHLLGRASLPTAVIKRIVAAAEGNPLYVEQMLAMLVDSRAVQHDDEASGLAGMAGVAEESGDEIVVPPTIRALLEARLDRLGREERATVEPAAVVGLEFPQPAVESLAPAVLRTAVPKHLASLSHKHFIRRAASNDADANFRFHHHLVRDTVYHGLLKRARATLHIEFVRWQDRINVERERGLELEEVLGYHLEQAHRYLSELGPLDEQGLAIGRDAAGRLSRAGKRAFERGDMHAAANLYRRAVTLLHESDPERLAMLPELGEVLMELGDFDGARKLLDEAAAQASRDGREGIEAHSKVMRMLVRMYSGEPGNWGMEAQQLAQACMPILEREGMHAQLANAWRLSGMVDMIAARYGRIVEAVEKSIAHARLAGDARMVSRSSVALSSSALAGPTPVPKAIGLCQQLIDDSTGDRQVDGSVLCIYALLRAMNGEFDAARELYRRGQSMLSELGRGVLTAATGMEVARVEMLAGELPEAERVLRTDLAFLKAHGETYFSSTMSAFLAQVLLEQGRSDEAMELTLVAESTSATDDIETQVLWRSIRAQILATGGKSAMAYELACVAVEMSLATDGPSCKAGAHMALASVCRITGRPAEARAAIDEAVGYFRLKEERVSLEKALRAAQSL
jgi:tetratricopeptide (TPR) repeat protein